MKLVELTDCIANYDKILIFVWDTGEVLYDGPNLESDPRTQIENKVLYITSENNRISIGVSSD